MRGIHKKVPNFPISGQVQPQIFQRHHINPFKRALRLGGAQLIASKQASSRKRVRARGRP